MEEENNNQVGTGENQIGEDKVDDAVCRKLDFDEAGNHVKIKTTENLVEKISKAEIVQTSASPLPSNAPTKWKLKARCRAINANDGIGK